MNALNPKLFLISYIQINTLLKQKLKSLIHFRSCVCTSFKVAIPSIRSPFLSFSGRDFSSFSITFVCTHNYFYSWFVYPILLHLIFPLYKVSERISIIYIKNHNYTLRIAIELFSDQFIIVVARKIKEIDSDILILQLHLLHSIVDPNSWYISLYKSSLTISFDQTWFPYFRVSNTYYFECYVLFHWKESFHRSRIVFLIFWYPGRFWISKGPLLLWVLLWVLPLKVIEVVLGRSFLLKTLNSTDHIRLLKTIIMFQVQIHQQLLQLFDRESTQIFRNYHRLWVFLFSKTPLRKCTRACSLCHFMRWWRHGMALPQLLP